MSSEITARVKKLGFDPNKAIRDALTDTVVTIRMADIVHAKQNNKKECVAARALCKMGTAADVDVFKSTIYVHHVNDDGGEVWLRYKPEDRLAKMIEAFDAAETDAEKVAVWETGKFRLLAPKGENTRDRIEARSKKRPGRHQPSKKKTGTTRKVKFRTRLSHHEGAG